MSAEEHVAVAVANDFVDRQTRARPVPALAELIWNCLDADATSVSVEFDRKDLAGEMSRIFVHDNGDGFPRERAKELFGSLGGSWKRDTRLTGRFKRAIHGSEGRGRYKAFALGRSAEWNVCHEATERRRSFRISLRQPDLTDVVIGADKPDDKRPTGVIVTVDDLYHAFRVFDTAEGLQELTEIFALYLINYKAVRISIAGVLLDAERAIATRSELALPSFLGQDGTAYSCSLDIIEWKAETRRTLYLCGSGGFPMDQVETRFHVPGFFFSAYLRSSYIDLLQKEDRLGLAEMDVALLAAVENARTAIKDYFRARASERARSLVDEWIEEKVYPFQGEPTTIIEKAERQVFDIVAVHLQKVAPDIGVGATQTKAFHLRMLRSAIERGPEDLQTIFREVLDLPAKQQKELASLLQETTLSSIITAAKTVADRLKFISALENVVFDSETKGRLKERTQLHKILAENTWVFGEEYNLWVSDKDLRRVLEKHKKYLDPSISIDEPVKVVGKKRGIIDLMFSRVTRRHRADDIEHMVVELKAPKVTIGSEEIVQAKKYANAVSADERFNSVSGIRWHFWIVSNAYDDYARDEIAGGPDEKRRLIHQKANVAVGIKTWGEIIEENRARLQFFQEHLQHSADESTAIRYLQEKHASFLAGVILEENDDEQADTDFVRQPPG